MTTEPLIRALEAVPAWHLAILDLVRELAGEEGINAEMAAERSAEIKLAIGEAQAYTRAVADMARALDVLPAIAVGWLH